jgi:YD repeat-containing protein
MKINVLIFTFCLFIFQKTLCQSNIAPSENLPKYPLKEILSYCQNDTNKLISKEVFTYDKDNRIVSAANFFDSLYKTVREFEYNNQGYLISITFKEILPEEKIKERKLIYTYEGNILISKEYENDQTNPKVYYHYNKKGQLTGIGQQDMFEYDKEGNIITKHVGNNIILYEYVLNKLVKEITRTNYRTTNEVFYEYDKNGLLLYKKEKGKIIEIYESGKLIRQWHNYYDHFPCEARPCCATFLKYNYFEN